MSWDPTIPIATQSPGLFPAQAHTNWQRLFAVVNADHNFTVNADGSQGFHKVVRWINQGGNPGSTTSPQTWTIDTTYRRSSTDVTAPHLWYRPTTATDTNTFPISVGCIRAYVLFDGSGSNTTNKTRFSSFGVSQVDKDANGDYTINFSPALPSATYCPIILGQRNGNGSGSQMCFGCIRDQAGSMTANLLKICFGSSGSDKHSVNIGSVVIVGG